MTMGMEFKIVPGVQFGFDAGGSIPPDPPEDHTRAPLAVVPPPAIPVCGSGMTGSSGCYVNF